MPTFQGTELYQTRDQVVAAMITLIQSMIPDVWIGEDGNLRILFEVEAGMIEGLYLANQVTLEDMFVQTANLGALLRHGDLYGLPQITGTVAAGELLFTGQGGTTIPIGTEVAFDPGGGGDVLYYVTTELGVLPQPGIPTAPTATDSGVSGTLTGTFEYAVAFVTASGETVLGATGNAVIVSAKQIDVSNIPQGGPGTTGRQIYRTTDGVTYILVHEISDNSTTTWRDNQATQISGEVPQTVSTAEQVLLDAQSENTGSQYNAVAGAITILAQAPEGLTAVTNPNPFVGGSDTENVDHYRNRLLDFIRSAQTGSVQDLINWALEVPGVESASVFPGDNLGTPTAGHVTVRIAGPGGSVPSSDVQDAVYDALSSKMLANITLHVGTFTPTTQAVTVDVTTGPNFTLPDVTPSVQQAIVEYIVSIPVGGTLYLSGIIDAVYGLPGVADVTVTSPGSNQTAAANHKFTPGTITVT